MQLIHPDNLTVDQSDIEQDAVEFIEGLDIAEAVNLLVVLGQQDPTAVNGDQPIWTEEQMQLILKAKVKLDNWNE